MVKIYSILNCPYCNQLKDILTKEGIEFVSVDVSLSENEAEYKKLNQITKSDEVPIVKIGKQLLVPNISFRSIPECYSLIDKFLKEV